MWRDMEALGKVRRSDEIQRGLFSEAGAFFRKQERKKVVEGNRQEVSLVLD